MSGLLYTHRAEESRIASIEYRRVKDGWVPFSVVTVRLGNVNWIDDYFDCSWSENDQCIYFHNSGSGGEGLGLCRFCDAEKPDFERMPIWINTELITPCSADLSKTPLSREDLWAMGYELVPEPLPLRGGDTVHPFEDSDVYDVSESDTVYCTICEDHYPEDSHCRHVFWDDRHGLWAGPGDSEHDRTEKQKDESFKASIFHLLNFMPRPDILRLKQGLDRNSFRTYYIGDLFGNTSWKFYVADEDGRERSIYCQFLDDLKYPDEEAIAPGFGWLSGLDPGSTQEADALTSQWVNQWLVESFR